MKRDIDWEGVQCFFIVAGAFLGAGILGGILVGICIALMK